jgi:hypothetical protein
MLKLFVWEIVKAGFFFQTNYANILKPVVRLSYLAASWGGKDNGFGLSKCCSDEPISSFPASATTLHFEFYAEVGNTSYFVNSLLVTASWTCVLKKNLN